MFRILIFIYSIFLTNSSLAEEFIVFGHAQELVNNKEGYKSFIRAIENENVDNIFVLGDSNLGNPKILSNFKAENKNRVHAVPGNHEYMGNIKSYLANFSQTNKDIETKETVFLLLDSNQSLKEVLELLKRWKDKYFHSEKTIILLTHHRLWDDSILSVLPYKHDKSYYFRDVYPLLSSFVDYIITGNSKRQHFQDLSESLNGNTPPNISTTYWEEVFPDFKAYNVGMGNGEPYATYIKFSVKDKILLPKSRSIEVSNDILDSYGIIDMNKFTPVWRDQEYTLYEKIFQSILNMYNKFYLFIFGFISGFISIVIIFRYKSRC